MAESFARKKELSNLEVEVESQFQTTLECSAKFDQNFNQMAPCLTLGSFNSQGPILAKNADLPSISSASTSRPTNTPFSMDEISRRNKNGEMKSLHRNLLGDVASKTKKGKEPLKYDEDESKSSSNKIGDEHEDLKDMNSRLIVSGVRRERTYDLESEKLVRGKKIKFMGNDNCSFKNWVTTITNGSTKSQHMKGVMCPPFSHEEGKHIDFSRGVGGFRSIFKAMCHPGFKLSSNPPKCIEYQKETDGEKESKRLEFDKDGFQVKKHPPDSMSSRYDSQNSIWIPRLSCRLSSPHQNSIKIPNCMNLSSQNIHNETEHKLPSIEVQTTLFNENPPPNSVPLNDSDHCKSNFQLTISSDYCKRSKPMISSFQHRFNALKEAKSVKVTDEKAIHCINTYQKAFTSHKNESAGMGAAINLDAINTDRLKTVPSSWENEFKKPELKPFCSHLTTIVVNELKGFFDTVRKLQLSRNDLLRCMKSRDNSNLGGFFLRLRIGKREKGFDATGYHVACINRAISQNSISVCVGHATYSVTSCFISNQDFDEGELKAWWFQKPKDGIKMPSSEELNEKLQLRMMLGF